MTMCCVIKRTLVLEIADRISVYLVSIIIIRLYISINELEKDVKLNSNIQ